MIPGYGFNQMDAAQAVVRRTVCRCSSQTTFKVVVLLYNQFVESNNINIPT